VTNGCNAMSARHVKHDDLVIAGGPGSDLGNAAHIVLAGQRLTLKSHLTGIIQLSTKAGGLHLLVRGLLGAFPTSEDRPPASKRRRPSEAFAAYGCSTQKPT
jgi:hypothetical protein